MYNQRRYKEKCREGKLFGDLNNILQFKNYFKYCLNLFFFVIDEIIKIVDSNYKGRYFNTRVRWYLIGLSKIYLCICFLDLINDFCDVYEYVRYSLEVLFVLLYFKMLGFVCM